MITCSVCHIIPCKCGTQQRIAFSRKKEQGKMLTWKCGICHQERPDEKIDVLSYPLQGLQGAVINLKYCNDKKECRDGAIEKSKT